MKVLLIGGGGREHAMAEALRRSGADLSALLPNHNPGIERLATTIKRAAVTDLEALRALAKDSGAQMLVVGPEAALGAGVCDEAKALGMLVASPSKKAARIETSKSFMRELLARRGVEGSLEATSFTDSRQARAHILASKFPVAVKPSGLTGGKGVQVEGRDFLLGDKEAASRYAAEVLEQRVGGEGQVVVERAAEGEEFTLMAFTDGNEVRTMPIVQDHKRALEGDKGPNTGGMGSYSLSDHSLPFLSPEDVSFAKKVMQNTVGALRAEGSPFVGVLYGQFMATVEGPRVIEFNARFGDPEAMNVLPLLESSYTAICRAMAEGHLADADVRFAKRATVCKYVVPKGYGTSAVAKGATIEVDETAAGKSGAHLFYAAVDAEGSRLRMSSSRALAFVGVADRLGPAEAAVEEALKAVRGEYDVRHDIGKPELLTRKVERMKGLRIKVARRSSP